jgi:hypothetical protein
MYLRVENYNENYCHLLNITKAILYATSKFNSIDVYLECTNQNRYDFCNNITNIFSNIYIIPTSNNIKIVNILQSAITNTLQCDKINNKIKNIKILQFNYDIIPFLFFIFLIAFWVLLKNKIKFH